jgi:hypothetical protein
VAITPFRLGKFDFAEVKRVCQDCTVAGLKAVSEANSTSPKPTTFVYMSAEGTPQDLSDKPFVLGDYQIMRVRFDSRCLGSSASSIMLILHTNMQFYRARRRR